MLFSTLKATSNSSRIISRNIYVERQSASNQSKRRDIVVANAVAVVVLGIVGTVVAVKHDSNGDGVLSNTLESERIRMRSTL